MNGRKINSSFLIVEVRGKKVSWGTLGIQDYVDIASRLGSWHNGHWHDGSGYWLRSGWIRYESNLIGSGRVRSNWVRTTQI